MITVVAVPFEDARARALWAAQQTELAERYGGPDIHPPLRPDGVIASLVALAEDGTPVGCVLARWSHYHPDGAAEVKRLYVVPERRGGGIARVLMGALERACERVGATRIVLEAGTRQPEAVALYRRIGYRDEPAFGPYSREPGLVCLAKDLPTRVLVLNGAMGAGKSATGYAALGLLGDAGVRVALLDADALCEAAPRDASDPYHQRLLFTSLVALAPVYLARGYGCLLVPRVVEDPDDRDRYARAFAGPGGPARVAIVRVDADASTRAARLVAREPEGAWQEFALARTEEIADALDALDLDDAVVFTDALTREEAAREALDAAGWWVPDAEPLV